MYGSDGRLAPFNWFDPGTRRRSGVAEVSTFVVLTMAPRRKQLYADLFSQNLFRNIPSQNAKAEVADILHTQGC